MNIIVYGPVKSPFRCPISFRAQLSCSSSSSRRPLAINQSTFRSENPSVCESIGGTLVPCVRYFPFVDLIHLVHVDSE
jgi:hypothetical protein